MVAVDEPPLGDEIWVLCVDSKLWDVRSEISSLSLEVGEDALFFLLLLINKLESNFLSVINARLWALAATDDDDLAPAVLPSSRRRANEQIDRRRMTAILILSK